MPITQADQKIIQARAEKLLKQEIEFSTVVYALTELFLISWHSAYRFTNKAALAIRDQNPNS